MSAARKEWVRISHSPTQTTATVTLQQGNLSVRWSVKTYSTGVAKGVKEARAGAERALADLVLAIDDGVDS